MDIRCCWLPPFSKQFDMSDIFPKNLGHVGPFWDDSPPWFQAFLEDSEVIKPAPCMDYLSRFA